jgi:hypothetical protein
LTAGKGEWVRGEGEERPAWLMWNFLLIQRWKYARIAMFDVYEMGCERYQILVFSVGAILLGRGILGRNGSEEAL